MVQEWIVLGHKISCHGSEVDKSKVEATEKLSPPTSVMSIRSLLWHAGFYSRFIKDFSKIAQPLTQFLEKGVPLNFSATYLESFNTLKERLLHSPIMISPN